MHMPGHKGRFGPPLLQTAAELDLTEIPGADSLFEADGIIAESEKMLPPSTELPIPFIPAQAPPCAFRPCFC